MDATQVIRARRSIRKFKEGVEIPDRDIELLLEAAMMAPSAANTRPWDFVVVKSREVRAQIAAAHPNAKMLPRVSLAVIVCVRPDLVPGGLGEFWPQDCAAATENLLLQATALGYGAVWCGVYPDAKRVERLRKILDTRSVPFCAIAVGAPDEAPRAHGFYDPGRVRYL